MREPNAKAVWAANDGSTQTTASLVMIGDVNLFFKGSPLDEDFEVEAEVMIAGVYHQIFEIVLPA